MSQNKFDIHETINADAVIGFTSVKEMDNLGWLDASKVSAYLMGSEGNAHKKHLGMIDLFATTHQVQVPFMRDLFANSAVLEVAEGQSITYDLPVAKSKMRCYTAEDTSNVTDYPGIDGNVFELVLSKEYTKGDILTYDPQYGEQVIVSNEHEVEQVGENFRHYVIYSTQDKAAYFPKDKLKAGIQWMKIGHALAELDTTFSGLSMSTNPAGTITNEFVLGSPRGVETFMTARASNMKAPGLTAFSDTMMDKVQNQLDALGGKNMFFIGKKKGNGIDAKSMKIGTTLEYLALMELAMMECHSLLFAKGATIPTANGVKRINEGAWHQLRRGKLIKYSRPGAISLDQIQEAASYVYKNTSIPVKDRMIKFKGGWFAYQNVIQLFREEVLQQLGSLPAGMLGTDGQLPSKVFSGTNDNLTMNAVVITSVMIPGVGKVVIEHDSSLDYQPMSDRVGAGFYGEGMAHTAWSLVMWDVTSSEYSNVTSKVKNASVVEGGNTRANIYYVKPEGAATIYGYEQGRMANGSQTSDIQSSLPYMGKTFWALSQSGALVLDTTRYVIIELQDKN